MEFKQDKQELVTRLAICVVAALIIYYGGEKICTAAKLSLWEQYKPWLEKNKVQAIATVAAALFGVSLVIFPLAEKETALPTACDDGFEPCEPCDLM